MQLLIVTGFLGAGKTSFLKQALQAGLLGKAALLVNEFGSVDIDGALLARAGATQLVQLPNGCVCCKVKTDFQDALTEIANRTRERAIALDRVVLETSGLADPSPLLAQLAESPSMRAMVTDVRVLCVFDMKQGPAVLEQHPESRHQLACADVVLASHGDLLEAGSCAGIHAMLRSRNHHARIFAVEQGVLCGTGRDDLMRVLGAPSAVAPSTAPLHGADCDHSHGAHASHNLHVHAHHSRDIETFRVQADAIASRDRLHEWLSFVVMRFAGQILRMKGFVSTAEAGRSWLVQGALGGVSLQPWPGGGLVAGTDLVFIARGMDDDHRRAALQAALSGLDASAVVTA